MFTGLITHIGFIKNLLKSDDGAKLTVTGPDDFLGDVAIGESIAISGACLTVSSIQGNSFTVDVSSETLGKTTISKWASGQIVNLEKSLRPNDRLGGHFVMGHVDGVARLLTVVKSGDGKILKFACDDEIVSKIVPKGSVAIDGISLTPTEKEKSSFSVAVIPHTLNATTLGKLRTGNEVNVEIDIFARYIFEFLTSLIEGSSAKKFPFDINSLREEGF